MTRWKINEAAREVLEDQYMRKRFPSPLSKKRLAEQLDVAPRRIQVWFQNRRQREKAGTEESEETPRQSPSFEDELDGVGRPVGFSTSLPPQDELSDAKCAARLCHLAPPRRSSCLC